ncbi:MAG: winged helix DNA-binding domain-containing protein [Bacillota bacterium]|jgi:hypothetical protein
MQTLTLTQAAWWNLRQLGLVQPFSSAEETVRSLVAVQAQDYAAAKQAVAARTVGEEQLDSLVQPGGPLLRMWTVRGTMHLVLAADAPDHQAATEAEWSQRWGRYLERRLPIPLAEVRQRIYPRIRDVLGEQPLTHVEISVRAGLERPYDSLLPHLLKDLCYLGDCVRGPQKGNRAVYFSSWYQPLPQDSAWPAKRRLIGRFIARYGPVTLADVVYWSGFRVPVVRQLLKEIQPQLATVRLEEQSDEAYLLAEQLPELLDSPGPRQDLQHYLPAFDVLLLAYKDKRRFLSDTHVPCVFRSAARVYPILLHNTRVIGTWQGKPPQVTLFEDGRPD